MKKQVALSTFVALVAGAIVVSSAGTPLLAQRGQSGASAKPAASASKDAAFIRTAADDGMAEVDHGQLATQNASSADVKQFAQRMVEDHGKANDELKALAQSKGVTLPTETDKKHKNKMDKLSKMQGPDFDRAYMKDMVKDHKDDVEDFRKEARKAKDGDLQGWASKTLPVLEEHLAMARKTNDIVQGSKRTGNRETGSTKK